MKSKEEAIFPISEERFKKLLKFEKEEGDWMKCVGLKEVYEKLKADHDRQLRNKTHSVLLERTTPTRGNSVTNVLFTNDDAVKESLDVKDKEILSLEEKVESLQSKMIKIGKLSSVFGVVSLSKVMSILRK